LFWCGNRNFIRSLWRIHSLFQQHRHVALDFFELIQAQVRVGDGEDVAGLRLLVDEHALAVADDLFLHLEDALAFEHHGEDVTGGGVARIILFDQFAQHRFRRVFLDRVHLWRGRFVNPLPVRDETLAFARAVAELVLPARLADVGAAQIFRALVEEQRVQRLPVGKRLAARLAGVGARLDVPLVHGQGNLTTNEADEHEEIFFFDTDSTDFH
jgi:hypothetical protein